jgi:hypothetical protein
MGGKNLDEERPWRSDMPGWAVFGSAKLRAAGALCIEFCYGDGIRFDPDGPCERS